MYNFFNNTVPQNSFLGTNISMIKAVANEIYELIVDYTQNICRYTK